MAHHVPRHQRVADQIQREMAQIIRAEIHDERVKMLTLTAVRVTSDLSQAKIFFTTLDREQHVAAQEILDEATPYLRSLLSHVMRLRMVPQLKFVYDESIERGLHMSAVIHAARARDEALREGDDSETPDSPAEADPDEGRV